MDNNFDPVREYFTKNGNKDEVFSGIGDYVRKVLAQHFPESDLTQPSSSEQHVRTAQPHQQTKPIFTLQEQIIELHGFVIVQIPLAEDLLNHLIMEANTTHLVLYGLPSGEQKKIKLPSCVRSDSAKAIYKEQLLEIRLPKIQDDHYHQIAVKRG